MKNVLFVFLLLFINNVIGQKRVDSIKVDFIESSVGFSEATQYHFDNIDKKWISRKNQAGAFFDDMCFKKIEVNNKTYFVLCIKTVEVLYKYPNIEQGRYINPIFKGFIFTELEFNKIKNYNESISSFYEIRTSLSQPDEFRRKVIETLTTDSFLKSEYIFKIKKEDENTIRFRLPEDYRTYATPFDNRYFETNIMEFSKLILFSE